MVTGVVGSASVIINIMIASIFSFKILLVFFLFLTLGMLNIPQNLIFEKNIGDYVVQ